MRLYEFEGDSSVSRDGSIQSPFCTRIVDFMNLAESIERGLDWLSTPKRFPGRLEMETQRGRSMEVEVISVAIRIPVAGGARVRIPVFLRVLPVGSSPIQGSKVRSARQKD